MKEIFALLMCAGLVLAVFGGCAAEQQEKEHTLEVGFGKINVTPDYGVPMSGNAVGDSRISDKAVDELYVTCIALTDETGKTILMYVQDILYCDAMALRKVIDTTGVPYENIMLSATHNHNAPGLSYSSHASIEQYQKTFDQAMVDAAVAAYSIGDVAFAAVPYEMFGPNGSAVKDGSPFTMTFVSTCTNGAGLYIPADYAFDYTIPCYEMSHNAYRRGTAEQLADEFVSMLNQIHGTRFREIK